MYAIIEDGGRQHKVEVARRINIDYRGELEAGSTIEFDSVLALSSEAGVTIGQPTIAGAKVVATVLETVKGPKLIICWFRRRKNSKKKTGHRQKYTRIQITSIEC